MANWKRAEVVANHRWTERLYSLRFEVELPAFKAGQFVRVGLDIDGERVARPDSLVNSPGRGPGEIYYNPVPEGPLSPRLAALQPGDQLWISDSANGLLVLDEIPDSRHLWLFATGTGVGPFVSMLATDEPWQRFERVVLVHSVRTAAELGYRDRFESLAQRHPAQFRYLPAVTREASPGCLDRRIPELLASGCLERSAELTISPEHAHVLLCGSAQMITDTTDMLGQRGLRKHRRREPGHISIEKYH
jgi:ferredoxin--NADP+ reductase